MPEFKLLPSAKYLHQCFDYDPDTGTLRWKKRRPIFHFADAWAWKAWNARHAGAVAGYIGPKGYLVVSINGRDYLVHRAIWKLMERGEPLNQIDHKDGDRTNNRWNNLRAATPLQQNWNVHLRKDNTSGLRGVSRVRSKWKLHE